MGMVVVMVVGCISPHDVLPFRSESSRLVHDFTCVVVLQGAMGKCSCCGAPGRTITGCSCRGGKSHVCQKLKTEEGLKEPKPEPDRATKPDEKHVEVVVVAQAKFDRDTKPHKKISEVVLEPKADLDTKPHDKHVVLEPKPESEFDTKPQKENVEVLVEPDEHTVSVNVSVHIRSK